VNVRDDWTALSPYCHADLHNLLHTMQAAFLGNRMLSFFVAQISINSSYVKEQCATTDIGAFNITWIF